MSYDGKGVFIAENMASTTVGSLLRSGKQGSAVENGSIVKLDGLVDSELDLYNTANIEEEATDVVYFVDGVELEYDEQLTRGLHDFVNPKDKPFRIRKPAVGDRFSISTNMIDGYDKSTTAYIGTKKGNKVTASADTPSEVSFIAKVVEKWNFGTRAIPMARLEVIHAI